MKLIMAMSLNGVIGIDGKLPWDVPEEDYTYLKFVMKQTT